jgi:hypothetical protein
MIDRYYIFEDSDNQEKHPEGEWVKYDDIKHLVEWHDASKEKPEKNDEYLVMYEYVGSKEISFGFCFLGKFTSPMVWEGCFMGLETEAKKIIAWRNKPEIPEWVKK